MFFNCCCEFGMGYKFNVFFDYSYFISKMINYNQHLDYEQYDKSEMFPGGSASTTLDILY